MILYLFFIFKIKAILSLSSSFLNQLGAKYWNKFATKNYFDKNGQFMLYFLNIPVLIELVLCLVSFLFKEKNDIENNFKIKNKNNNIKNI